MLTKKEFIKQYKKLTPEQKKEVKQFHEEKYKNAICDCEYPAFVKVIEETPETITTKKNLLLNNAIKQDVLYLAYTPSWGGTAVGYVTMETLADGREFYYSDGTTVTASIVKNENGDYTVRAYRNRDEYDFLGVSIKHFETLNKAREAIEKGFMKIFHDGKFNKCR